MRDVLPDYERLAAAGEPPGRAVVTSVWGSAPRPEGATMLATRNGAMAGSVSGGCVEGATATEIGAALGRAAHVFDDGRVHGDLGPGIPRDVVCKGALAALERESSTTLALETPEGAASVFLEVFPSQPRLVIFGGVHIA